MQACVHMSSSVSSLPRHCSTIPAITHSRRVPIISQRALPLFTPDVLIPSQPQQTSEAHATVHSTPSAVRQPARMDGVPAPVAAPPVCCSPPRVEVEAPRTPPAQGTRLPLLQATIDLTQPLPVKVYAAELGAAALTGLGIWMWQGRPVGWVQQGVQLEVRPSTVAGLGLYTCVPIPEGTILGAYPGRVRSSKEMAAKVESAPSAASYAFSTGDGRYVDPTDEEGEPSPWPAPGPPWPVPVDLYLPFANEPPIGGGGTNCFIEQGSAGPTELIFQANRDIEAGEEIFIDYGLLYDRSSYGSS